MKKVLTLLLSSSFPVALFAQSGTLKQEQNVVSLSAPFVFWQNQEIVNLIGRPRRLDGRPYEGTATSAGLNLCYKRFLYKGFFITGGIGYFPTEIQYPQTL